MPHLTGIILAGGMGGVEDYARFGTSLLPDAIGGQPRAGGYLPERRMPTTQRRT